MKKWADHAPMNYRHKYELVEAELARIRGKTLKAMAHYGRAIELAHRNRYLHEEALAYELAGRFYYQIKQAKIAQSYLFEAHYVYLRWGALAKVEALIE